MGLPIPFILSLNSTVESRCVDNHRQTFDTTHDILFNVMLIAYSVQQQIWKSYMVLCSSVGGSTFRWGRCLAYITETVIIMGVMIGERHAPYQLNTLCGDLENEQMQLSRLNLINQQSANCWWNRVTQNRLSNDDNAAFSITFHYTKNVLQPDRHLKIIF